MSAETKIQDFIHKLEVGGLVPWIKFGLVTAILATIFSVCIFDVKEWYSFCGLSHEKGMDQAQIARQLARGEGFTTKFVRPAALAQIKENLGGYPQVDKMPDTYHAPLNPAINSVLIRVFDKVADFFRARGEAWQNFTFNKEMTRKDVVYAYDRIISAFALIFFILSLGINYLTARRLFDSTLAIHGTLLLIFCSRFWEFGQTGLPQNLMVLLFSGVTYALVRAVEKREEGNTPWLWLVAVGVGFGFLALAHALTLWIFAGALVYCGLAFRPRAAVVGLLFGIVAIMYGPWIVRNYKVCGDAFGISHYSGLFQIRGTEMAVMRSQELEFGVTPTNFRAKVQKETERQFGDIFRLFGGILVAPLFLLSALHFFKRPGTASLKWGLLLMWLFAVFGMSAFGFPDIGELQANDLHLLFIPTATFYGLAFILVLWTRLEIRVRLIRFAFFGLIYAVSILPMMNLLLQKRNKVQWPPYAPPFIGILAEWIAPEEMIMSDMPWGVAWYANRPSLWLPTTVNDFLDLNDYSRLGPKVVALYLTPVSGNAPFLSSVAKGPYGPWAQFIMRNNQIRDFPLRAMTGLPLDNDCVIYADRPRWSESQD